MDSSQPMDKKRTVRDHVVGAFFAAYSFGMRVLVNLAPGHNFSAMGALGTFGGGRLRFLPACLFTVGAMVGADFALWVYHNYDWQYSVLHPSRPIVYGSFVLYVVLGWALARNHSPWRIGLASVLGSLQFFLLTNFGAWLVYADQYSRDLSGLLLAYAAGLPFYDSNNPLGFFGNTLIGDLLFTGCFFGLHLAIDKIRQPVAAESTS